MHETSRNVAKKESLELRARTCCTMPSRDTVHVPYDMNIIMVGPRKQVEMLKQHEIQKSHAWENVSYDVVMRHSTRNTRLRISRFSCIRTPQWLSNYHSDSLCLTKVNFTISLLIFLPKMNKFRLRQAIIKAEPLWFNKMFPHQFKMDLLRNQTMITHPA